MTKKELSQLRYLYREIEILQDEIDAALSRCDVTSDVVSGSDHTWPYIKKRYHITGIDDDYVRERKQRLKGRMKKLIKSRDEIEAYISTISDSQTRMIFTLRYIDGLSWRKVAIKIGGKNTEDSVRVTHNRYLQGM